MQAWMFEAMQDLRDGKKVSGQKLLGLKELGYIWLEPGTESWMPTPEANEEFKMMAKELQNGKMQYKAG